jgi:hypothetical protein
MEQFLAFLTEYAGIARTLTLIVAPIDFVLLVLYLVLKYRPEWVEPTIIKVARFFGKELTPTRPLSPPLDKPVDKKD